MSKQKDSDASETFVLGFGLPHDGDIGSTLDASVLIVEAPTSDGVAPALDDLFPALMAVGVTVLVEGDVPDVDLPDPLLQCDLPGPKEGLDRG